MNEDRIENKDEADDNKKVEEVKAKIDKKMPIETKIGWVFLTIVVSAILIYGIFSVSGFSISGRAVLDNYPQISNQNSKTQEINMEVGYGGYRPNSFVLKKDIPVIWNINVKELTGCNNRIISNELNLDISLKKGLNVVKFTPQKTGTIAFSCSMNMLRGTFLITEDGQATKEQVASAKPTAGSCGGGSGCGGCGGSCSSGCGV